LPNQLLTCANLLPRTLGNELEALRLRVSELFAIVAERREQLLETALGRRLVHTILSMFRRVGSLDRRKQALSTML
jgi:hypothetical protein